MQHTLSASYLKKIIFLGCIMSMFLGASFASAQLTPDITVAHPAETNLVNNVGTIGYGNVTIAFTVTKVFTIRNVGTANLTGISISKTGIANAQFIISTTGMATTLAPNASTTFTVTFAPTGTIIGDRVASIRVASNDPDENPFDIAVTGFGYLPEIAVEQPLGTNLVDGTATIAYGTVALGSTTRRTFTIKNSGSGDLTGLTFTKIGTGMADFTVESSGMAIPLPAASSTEFTIAFTPVSTNVSRTATIRIASNDANENPFDINLSGIAYSDINDTDKDGLNDLAEIRLAPLGFNWQSSQVPLVQALINGAPAAGLYATSGQQLLQIRSSLTKPQSSENTFQLLIGLRKGTTSQNFIELPISSSSISHTSEGFLECFIPVPEPGAFFKVTAE